MPAPVWLANHQDPPAQSNPAVVYIIWAASLTACPLYGLVLWLISDGRLTSTNPSSIPIPGAVVVAFLTLMDLLVCVFVMTVLKKQPHPDDSPSLQLGRFQTHMIIQGSFYEAIAIYAVVGRLAFGLTLLEANAFIAFSAFLLLTLLPGIQRAVDTYNRRLRGGEANPGRFQ